MKIILQKINKFCGERASFYTVLIDDLTTPWGDFVVENKGAYLPELMQIAGRIKNMADVNGANEIYFKPDESSNPLDRKVVAFYDIPDSKLRLYCVKMSNNLVVVGGGGPKEKGLIRAWQQSRKLTREVELMMHVSALIDMKMASGELNISADNLHFTGNLRLS